MESSYVNPELNSSSSLSSPIPSPLSSPFSSPDFTRKKVNAHQVITNSGGNETQSVRKGLLEKKVTHVQKKELAVEKNSSSSLANVSSLLAKIEDFKLNFEKDLKDNPLGLFESFRKALDLKCKDRALIICYSKDSKMFSAVSNKNLKDSYSLVSWNSLVRIVAFFKESQVISEKRKQHLADQLSSISTWFNNDYFNLDYTNEDLFKSFEKAVHDSVNNKTILIFDEKNKRFLSLEPQVAEKNNAYKFISNKDFMDIICNFEAKLDKVSNWQLQNLHVQEHFLYNKSKEMSTAEKVANTAFYKSTGKWDQIEKGADTLQKINRIEKSVGRLTLQNKLMVINLRESIKKTHYRITDLIKQMQNSYNYDSIIHNLSENQLSHDDMLFMLNKIKEIESLDKESLDILIRSTNSFYQGSLHDLEGVKLYFKSLKTITFQAYTLITQQFSLDIEGVKLTGQVAIREFRKTYQEYKDLEEEMHSIHI